MRYTYIKATRPLFEKVKQKLQIQKNNIVYKENDKHEEQIHWYNDSERDMLRQTLQIYRKIKY